MNAQARLDTVVAALNLPADARVDARIPKSLLLEQGAPTPADRKAISAGIEEMRWIAALKPTTVAIPAFSDETRDYPEIAILTALLRTGARTTRLTELIHRSIPYPLVLITDGIDGLIVSLAPKRAARNEGDKVVVEWIVATDGLILGAPGAPDRAFLDGLALQRQPARDLSTVYDSWIGRCEALAAARLSGVFEPTDDAAWIEQRRAALAEHEGLEKEAAKLRALAAREKQMVRRVELNQRIKALEADMAKAKAAMTGQRI